MNISKFRKTNIKFKRRKPIFFYKKGLLKKRKFLNVNNRRSANISRKLRTFWGLLKSNIHYLAIFFTVLVIGFILYKSVDFKKNDKPRQKIDQVIGLDVYVPVASGTYFAFQDIPSDEQVQQLISYNMSCYVIPDTYTFDEIKDSYKNTLADYNWQFVGEAGYSDTNNEIGMYFVNNIDGVGLRIYTISNDIWYEKISIDDANNLLQSRKSIKNNLRELIKVLYGENLPEYYPFDFKYSYEYSLKEIKNNELNALGFTLESKNEKVQVIPFRNQVNINIEEAIPKFLEETFKNTTQDIHVVGTSTEIHNNITFIVTGIIVNDKSYELASFINSKNKIIYIVSGLECHDVVAFNYVIENIKIK